MNSREALEEVHKDLATAFGEDLAERILSGVLNSARATDGNLDRAAYVEVVRTLGRDERVIGMFGELSVRDKLGRWEGLM